MASNIIERWKALA